MLRIRKLDIFIVKSFLMLFIGTFFICLFIFMMQFLWRYVDDLVGKGLEMSVMAQFFFYSGLTLVPVAMPLAVLLASLITFGNFGERYELLAMKAAGISLLHIMRPLAFFVVGLVGVSFYFQDVIAPIAQAKFGTLMYSMRQKSPELDIPEGVFYSEIPDYNLKVGKKNRKTGMLYDVLIYNFKEGFEYVHVIYADSGKLEMTADKQHLWLHLYSGDLFENLRAQNTKSQNVPYRREAFTEKHSIIEFNSDFSMVDGSLMSQQSSAKNMRLLQASIDSMQVTGDSIGRQYYREVSEANYRAPYGLTKEDTIKIENADLREYNVDSLFRVASLMQKQKILSTAVSRAESVGGDISLKSYTMDDNDYRIRRHKIEWHKKLTISLSCLLFFFIGAPLGGIIRKGGLGMPVIVSVFVFIVYYIIDNTGYKMARDGKWIAWMGMWTSSSVLAPLGMFLTYKSNKDSVVLNADAYMQRIKKLLGIRDVRHLFKKEVIINDPDYVRVAQELRLLAEECRRYIVDNRLRRAPHNVRLWTVDYANDEVVRISEQLEKVVEELSNTKTVSLLNAVNNYPILSITAHMRPFHAHWMNLAAGILLPIGVFFYLRIWAFRVRLAKDMEKIIKNSEEIQTSIQEIKE